MYNRLLTTSLKKSSKSFLLLGPRQVGKSTLIESLKPDLNINLSIEKEYFLFQTELDELERRISATGAKTIFIDEIQRIPRLTNSIQALIDQNQKLRFYLTGSSARKLRRGKANLLPGRLVNYQLAPLAAEEFGDEWNESNAMKFGCLPGIVSMGHQRDKKEVLRAYALNYLKEEIQAEALVRQIDGFIRFMNVIAIEAGKYLDYSKIAKRAKVPRQSITRHFEILEDTLIARRFGNDPELDDSEVDLIKHPRFFFFDLGVLNALRGNFEIHPERLGFLFEHMVINQIINSATGRNLDFEIYNFRTRGGLEIDFIFKIKNQKFAIECKSGQTVDSNDVNTLKRIDQYYKKIQKLIVYRGSRELKENGVWILPFQKARKVLGL
jgi:predicted AAA+ superfamily ATPase